MFVGRCTARSPLDKNRYDTSLGLLTKKFVGLLTSAEEGVGGVLCRYTYVRQRHSRMLSE